MLIFISLYPCIVDAVIYAIRLVTNNAYAYRPIIYFAKMSAVLKITANVSITCHQSSYVKPMWFYFRMTSRSHVVATIDIVLSQCRDWTFLQGRV